MAAPRRPLPIPPVAPPRNDWDGFYPHGGLPGGLPDMYPSYGTPYMAPYPHHPPFALPQQTAPEYEAPSATLRGGTLLHKGFYDLLSLIPSIPSTPSPSRLFWPRAQAPDDELISGPRYEQIPTNDMSSPKPIAPPTSPISPAPRNLKARRISKDMVSKPIGFVYVHRVSRLDS